MALGRLFTPPSESRAVTMASLFKSGQILTTATSSGVSVTQETALKVNACYAAVRLYVDTVSMLPMDTSYRKNGERLPFRPRPVWVDEPDVDGLTRQQFYAQWIASKLISHAACVRVLRNNLGDVVALSVMDPRRVERKRDEDGHIVYSIDFGKYILQADEVIYDSELLMAGQLMGTSRVDQIKETLGLTQALETFAARFFGNGTTTSGVIEVPTEITAEQAKGLQDGWEDGHKGLRKAHRPGVLAGGAKFVKTGVDPDEAQMLESRMFALEEVARAFRIPPNMLQSQKPGSVAYASREQDALQWVTFSLMPYITAIEDHLTRLLPGGAFVKFNVDALSRASLTDRFAAYSVGTQSGFMSINDVHRLEDWRPVSGGDEYRVPLANVNLAAANIVEDEKRVAMATALVDAGFDHASALAAVGLPPVEVAPAPEPAPVAPPADPTPARTVRSVIRNADGFITAVVDEETA